MTRRNAAVGLFLIFTGIAQILPGDGAVAGVFTSWLPVSVSAIAATWLAPVLWGVAMLGFVAAGFGVLGVAPFAARQGMIALVAFAGSLLLIALFWSDYALVTVLLDLVALAVVLRLNDPAPRSTARLGQTIAAAALVYLGAVLVFRDSYINLGTVRAERHALFPGDSITREPAAQYTRATTVHAPASAVWPWLLQIGQDRAGLYSYDWLERMLGFGVHNVDTIVPRWQNRAVGDFVRIAPPHWLGGVLGPNVGFRIAQIIPNRALTLTSGFVDWSFVLQPVDDHTTRLLARGRVHRGRDIAYYFKALAAVLVIEPAHTVMERKMLMTLKQRAESLERAPATASR